MKRIYKTIYMQRVANASIFGVELVSSLKARNSNLLRFIAAVISFVVIAVLVMTSACAEDVHFFDPVFEKMLRSALNHAGGPITREELAKYGAIHISDSKMQLIRVDQIQFELDEWKGNLWLDFVMQGDVEIGDRIEGEILTMRDLMYFPNLEYLWIRAQPIDDLTPLKELKKIKAISMALNNLSDISPIADLTQLGHLELIANNIKDVKPLESLIHLRTLILEGNNIGDLSPLKGLDSLVWLNLVGNAIAHIDALEGMVKLETLCLSGNQICDLKPLRNLVSLDNLYLSNNAITDLSPLADLTPWNLVLDGNPITDWDPVAHLNYVKGRPEV